MNGIGKTSTTQKLMQCQRTQVTMMSDQVLVHEVECENSWAREKLGMCLCTVLRLAYERGRADEQAKAVQRVNNAAMKIALAGISRFETADFLDLMDAAVRDGELG
jgi:hypothetical protein